MMGRVLRCMGPELARNGPQAMSAIWSLTGAKRTSASDCRTNTIIVFEDNDDLWIWVPGRASLARDDERAYAVTASTTSSSSKSSTIGAKVESGLVESVIGLRWEADEVERAAGPRDSA
jgi:hypothetical protein